MMNSFFNILFDDNESTCFAKYLKGTSLRPVSEIEDAATYSQFFSINALTDKRADANVTVFRNILLEMDDLPIDRQKELIEQSGLPYSTAVYSGGKSIHFIISLKTPLTDKTEYAYLVSRLYKAFNTVAPGALDMACKNPSRLSRFPNVKRLDTNEKQELITINERIDNEVLNNWVNAIIGKEDTKVKLIKSINYANKERAKYGLSGNPMFLSTATKNYLMFGAEEGTRNRTVYRVGCDFAEKGFSIEEAIERISNISTLEADEIEQTVGSAYRRVEADQINNQVKGRN